MNLSSLPHSLHSLLTLPREADLNLSCSLLSSPLFVFFPLKRVLPSTGGTLLQIRKFILVVIIAIYTLVALPRCHDTRPIFFGSIFFGEMAGTWSQYIVLKSMPNIFLWQGVYVLAGVVFFLCVILRGIVWCGCGKF